MTRRIANVGTRHGFCFAERAVHDAEAAEQTSTDIPGMFKRRRR